MGLLRPSGWWVALFLCVACATLAAPAGYVGRRRQFECGTSAGSYLMAE